MFMQCIHIMLSVISTYTIWQKRKKNRKCVSSHALTNENQTKQLNFLTWQLHLKYDREFSSDGEEMRSAVGESLRHAPRRSVSTAIALKNTDITFGSSGKSHSAQQGLIETQNSPSAAIIGLHPSSLKSHFSDCISGSPSHAVLIRPITLSCL